MLTIVNVVIVALATVKGVEYVDSVPFCGGVCHTPMEPEGRSSHSDDKGCFRCHDEEHKTADGGAISQDCELCHRQ